MIKLVARREHTWMDRKTDYRQWDQLVRAMGAELQLLEDNELYEPHGEIIVVDQNGQYALPDFIHPKEGTYVFGRTGCADLTVTVPHSRSVRIDTGGISLFGCEAASMLLYDRSQKFLTT